MVPAPRRSLATMRTLQRRRRKEGWWQIAESGRVLERVSYRRPHSDSDGRLVSRKKYKTTCDSTNNQARQGNGKESRKDDETSERQDGEHAGKRA